MNNQRTPTETTATDAMAVARYNTMREYAVRDVANASLRAQGVDPYEATATEWQTAVDAARASVCGCMPDPRHYGGTAFTDGTCRLPAGHSGAHVGVHRDGTHTGYNRAVAS